MSQSFNRRALIVAGTGTLVAGVGILAQPKEAKAFSPGLNNVFAVHGNAVIAENSSLPKTISGSGTSFSFSTNTSGWFDIPVPAASSIENTPLYLSGITLFFSATGSAGIYQVNLYDGLTLKTNLLFSNTIYGNYSTNGFFISLTSAQQFLISNGLGVSIEVICEGRGSSGTFLLAGLRAICPQSQ